MRSWALALAGLLALSASPTLAAKAVRPAGFQACRGITFYSSDEDAAGLNIRSGPGMKYPVLGRTAWRHLNMTAFDVTGSQDGWFKVRAVGEWDYRNQRMLPLRSYKGEGWVSADKLLVEYYAGDQFFLRDSPGSKRGLHVLRELETGGEQRLIACKDTWVLIEHSEWIPADDWKSEVQKTYSGWIEGTCRPRQRCPFLPTGGRTS